jgi:hypothetical protein
MGILALAIVGVNHSQGDIRFSAEDVVRFSGTRVPETEQAAPNEEAIVAGE